MFSHVMIGTNDLEKAKSFFEKAGLPAMISSQRCKAATYAFVNPIVAVLLGALFAGETVTVRTLIAAALIIGSVALVITAQQLRSKAEPPVSAALEPAD